MRLKVKQLDSGYWHIRGEGPCNWTQPPTYPCDPADIRKHAHPEASDEFIAAVLRDNRERVEYVEPEPPKEEIPSPRPPIGGVKCWDEYVDGGGE